MNVIGLFNGVIPLVAIQMQAFRIGDQVSLVFTTVLNEMRLGLEDEDEEEDIADRAYWEKRSGRNTLEVTDSLLALVHEFAPDLSLKYNKFYIGLAKDGRPNNFVIFRPKKDWVRFEPRLERSNEIQSKLEEAGIDIMEYDARWGRYRIRLSKGEVKRHEQLLRDLLKQAYGQGEE